MKHKKLFGIAAIFAVALTLSACAGSAGDTTAGNSVAAETKAPAADAPPAEEPAAEASAQTVQEGCVAMAGPLADAGQAMQESMEDATSDPQAAVAVWTDLTNGFETIAAEAQNDEVKAAATTVHTDVAAMRDAVQKVFVNNDVSLMAEYTAAAEAMGKSYSALLTLCQ
ncbi:hypothetical protein ACXR2W_00510 [Leucobacter sp. HY1908]